MPITVYVVAAEPSERAWLESALARGPGIETVFIDNEATLLDAPPTGRSCVLALADTEQAATATLALVRDLRRRTATLPVIVLGTHTAFRTAVEMARLPATDFLERPISAHQVRAAVWRAVAGTG